MLILRFDHDVKNKTNVNNNTTDLYPTYKGVINLANFNIEKLEDETKCKKQVAVIKYFQLI